MKKEKIILAAILIPLSAVLSVYLASGLLLLLSREWEGLHQLRRFWPLVGYLFSVKQGGVIYLCVEGLLGLGVVMMLFMGKDKNHTVYESPTRAVTDKIRTPVAAGQNQHGSSKWLERAECRKAFGVFLFDPERPEIRGLLEQDEKEAKP